MRASYHVDTHFVQTLASGAMRVERRDMIPVNFVPWNTAVNGLATRFGLGEGKPLEIPLLECVLKNKSLKYPCSMAPLVAFGLPDMGEAETIEKEIHKIHVILKAYFERRAFRLVAFRFEFGRKQGKLILGDELTLESFLFFAAETGIPSSKTPFQWSEGEVETLYARLTERLLT